MKPAPFFLFCLRHPYGETRLFRNIPFVAWRERRGSARLCPFFFHSIEKHLLCACFIFADEVNVDHRSKQPVWCTVLDTYWQQLLLVSSWILDKGSYPLRLGVKRRLISRRQNSDGSFRFPRSLVHFQDKITPLSDIPRLYDNGVASFLELPSNPLRPLAVSSVITDKEILHL